MSTFELRYSGRPHLASEAVGNHQNPILDVWSWDRNWLQERAPCYEGIGSRDAQCELTRTWGNGSWSCFYNTKSRNCKGQRVATIHTTYICHRRQMRAGFSQEPWLRLIDRHDEALTVLNAIIEGPHEIFRVSSTTRRVWWVSLAKLPVGYSYNTTTNEPFGYHALPCCKPKVGIL